MSETLPPRLAAFRSREFSLYIAVRLMTVLATQMVDVAVAWLIYEITGSAIALGLIGLCIFLPNIAFLLFAGHVADNFDRRLVLVVCFAATLAASVGLYFAVASGAPTAIPIFVLVALIGTARAFSSPAGAAILPNLVPREHFANAVALNSSAGQIATIAGPALGGLIYLLGPKAVFVTTTILYACALVCLALMRARPASQARVGMSWAYLTAGFGFIRRNEIVLGAIMLDLFAVLLSGAVALLPIFAKDIFHADASALGILRSGPAIGAVAMSFAIVHFRMTGKIGHRLFQSVAAFGFATIGFGLCTNMWIALGFLICLGAADMISVYIRSALVQIETPDEMRGRVSAVNSMFIGASNELGQFEAGVVAHFTGPVLAVVLGGVGTLGVTFAGMKLFPALLNRDKLG